MPPRGRTSLRPSGDLAASRTRLRAVVAPVVETAGCDLEDLTVSRAGRRHVVRVIVDADGGVNLDTVAVLSRSVSAALDAAEADGGAFPMGEYTLEVSSPGVDRPLTLPRHWRRNVGRLVAVRAGGRQVTGRIVEATESGVRLEVDGRRLEVGHQELGPGRVQVDFSRAAELPDDDLADGLSDDDVSDDDLADEELDGDEMDGDEPLEDEPPTDEVADKIAEDEEGEDEE